MHGVYNTQTYLPDQTLKDFWEEACIQLKLEKKYHLLQAPILTRWWSVGVCAMELDADWEIYKYRNNALVNLPNRLISDSFRKVVSANKNLFRLNEIRSDVKMIAAIHQNFMNSHFKFLQKGDSISGNVPGYQARLILPRYFLMHDDLTSCINGKWKENESYQNVIEYNQNNLSIETQQLQERKMEHTFNIMTTSLRKHFDAWANRHLPLALWSEQPIAQAVALFLLNRPPMVLCMSHLFTNKNLMLQSFMSF